VTFAGVGDRYVCPPRADQAAASVPVIASLNATSTGWLGRSTQSELQGAGADALELNVYRVAADASKSAADLEAADLALVAAVRAAVTIPLAVKLSPSIRLSPGHAARVIESGANGLVLFNRFYQPDLDLESLEVAKQDRTQRAVGTAPGRCAGSPSCGPSSAMAYRSRPRPASVRARTRFKALMVVPTWR